MGLSGLETKLAALKEKLHSQFGDKASWIWEAKQGILNIAHFICLDDFLKYLALNPAILAQFRELLNVGTVLITELSAATQLVIAQLRVVNDLAQATISQFEALEAATIGRLDTFAFGGSSFRNCPPVQKIKEIIMTNIPHPDPASLIPGNAKKVAKKYKMYKAGLRGLKYDLLRNEQYIQALEAKVVEYEMVLKTWTMILEAIDEQFPTTFIS